MNMDEFQFDALYSTLAFLVLTLYLSRNVINSAKKRNLPPSPPRLPVVGNLHQLGQLPHRSLAKLSRKHGPLMLLHFGSKPAFIVSSAEAAKQVLKTHDPSFANRPRLKDFEKLFYDMKNVIGLEYGEQWKKLRSIFMQELLNNSRVKSFNMIREQETALLVEKIKRSCLSSTPVNMCDVFVSLSNDFISHAAFGKRHSDTDHGKKLLELLDEAVPLLLGFRIGEFVSWLSWIDRFSGFNAKIDKVFEKREEIFNAIIEEHLESVTSESRDNFVDILLNIYKGNIPGVSIDLISVKAVILDALAAGTETSSTTLGWAMTELIRHPQVMKKLQEEIRNVMKEKHNVKDEDIAKMPYLKAVVKETLRYHPPVAMFGRMSKEHVNVMGYDIEPDTTILVNVWAIGRDPDYWDEPDEFKPERFLNSPLEFRGSNFQYIPFGAGRRICPGIGFGIMSVEHTLASLMHKFDWALPDGGEGEDLDATEQTGITVRRKNPLILAPTKCYF